MKFYTVEEVAKILRTTPNTIRIYINEGKIKAIKSGKQYLISDENIERYIKDIAWISRNLSPSVQSREIDFYVQLYIWYTYNYLYYISNVWLYTIII